jgi:uncharacterized protein (TIGR02246 family)
MGEDAESAARALLAELEERLAQKDLEQIAELFTDDAVLIGSEVESFDRESTVDFLTLMAQMGPTAHWRWDRVVAQDSAPGLLCFSAAGAMWFDDENGQRMSDPEPYRVSCLAVEQAGRLRWRHFHGSARRKD